MYERRRPPRPEAAHPPRSVEETARLVHPVRWGHLGMNAQVLSDRSEQRIETPVTGRTRLISHEKAEPVAVIVGTPQALEHQPKPPGLVSVVECSDVTGDVD